MRNRTTANFVKIAVIAVALALAASCTVAGTLAAFSATYTWKSDQATAGEFRFEDTTYTLELFGDEYILPGGSGSAVLEGVDFADVPVVWGFAANPADDRVIPVVFWLADDGGPISGTYYSAYGFSGLGGFVRAGDVIVAASGISASPEALTESLAVGVTVCWCWPDTIYADAAGAETDEKTFATYKSYCEEVCEPLYSFSADTLGTVFEFEGSSGSVNVLGNVTGVDGENLNALSYESAAFSVEGGLCRFDGSPAWVENGGKFETVSLPKKLDGESRAWLLVATLQLTEDISAALRELGIEIGGTYTFTGEETEIVLTPAADGSRTLIKVPVSATGIRASLSVTITAVVTA